ncbi:phosphoribosylformylglycinamidine synthase [Fulvivirgaceae bacterium PWU4]|uniref:Phosphoribosylformylglycinamidine synthase n=1 Tax=Chryseosolibacter histidini TaxID=2782349 RepID=A0AAP2GNX3_9BACT|nr:HAEPLYID family protein [Chryseosolibacter histidini]MBT1696952.1 phosphoribosylformylglycinamidine synthase [Chryseosolibacter histidini]
MTQYRIILIALTTLCLRGFSQTPDALPAKVSHAEPIYFDLIRDLGARKGERELNIGIGMTSTRSYTAHTYLVEYEFAPLNRLGLEIELPLAFYSPVSKENAAGLHAHSGIEGIKTAVQYSFFVSEKLQTTMAAGYIFESKQGPNLLRRRGGLHNPFMIIAKKWGSQFHSLIYAGPSFERDTEYKRQKTSWLVNANVHYTLPGTRNFVGIETNEKIDHHHFEMIVRPQVKMALSATTSLGLALGIPAGVHDTHLDFLLRWVYEARKKVK